MAQSPLGNFLHVRGVNLVSNLPKRFGKYFPTRQQVVVEKVHIFLFDIQLWWHFT
jgi:hypothetical protein